MGLNCLASSTLLLKFLLEAEGRVYRCGVIEEGRLLVSETGTGQGQTISPLLANI
jgi:hypothetical protein